jgi:hypothetical protein
MSRDPLIGPKSKIEWAVAHITDFEKTIHANQGSSFFSLTVELNPARTEESVKLQVKPIPPVFGVMTGNVIYNLRSALDHLANALVVLGGGTGSSSLHFPIVRAPDGFETHRSGPKIRKFAPAAWRMMADLQPYKPGYELLGALNALRNLDAHTSLVDSIRPLYGLARWDPINHRQEMMQVPDWQSIKKGVIISSGLPGTQAKQQFEFLVPVGIAFGEIETIKGQSILPTLRQFGDLVKSIVENFERRFFS